VVPVADALGRTRSGHTEQTEEAQVDEWQAVDAVVVGGGPAGLAATGWLGRYRRRTLLVDAGEGRNRWTEEMHGLPGLDRAGPGVLRERARAELAAYPDVACHDGRVTAIHRLEDGGFHVEIDGTEHVGARRIVLATGVRDAFPDVEGFFEHYGAGVQHCPTCDGYEAKGRRVVAIGSDANVAGFAVSLLDWAEEVRVVSDGAPLACTDTERAALAERGVEVIDAVAQALVGPRGALRALRLDDGSEVACEMAFFSIAHHPVTDLAESLGCALGEGGHVAVDGECATSVPGVYAAGDLTPGMQLVPVALGAGTIAGVACARSLQGEPALPAGPTPAPVPAAVMD
jgi:thioredoxin reductase